MTAVEILAAMLGAALGWATGSVKAWLHRLRRPPDSRSDGARHGQDAALSTAPEPTGAGTPLDHRIASRVGVNPLAA
jgi:hypothetical protein